MTFPRGRFSRLRRCGDSCPALRAFRGYAQRQFTKDPCWEGLAKWTVPGPLNFGSDSNTRPASGIARLLQRG
jgi:hypothetical protein